MQLQDKCFEDTFNPKYSICNSNSHAWPKDHTDSRDKQTKTPHVKPLLCTDLFVLNILGPCFPVLDGWHNDSDRPSSMEWTCRRRVWLQGEVQSPSHGIRLKKIQEPTTSFLYGVWPVWLSKLQSQSNSLEQNTYVNRQYLFSVH